MKELLGFMYHSLFAIEYYCYSPPDPERPGYRLNDKRSSGWIGQSWVLELIYCSWQTMTGDRNSLFMGGRHKLFYDECCATCKYYCAPYGTYGPTWETYEYSDGNDCRLYPPTGAGSWPKTPMGAWCGGYERFTPRKEREKTR
jgi:hypothetical protein